MGKQNGGQFAHRRSAWNENEEARLWQRIVSFITSALVLYTCVPMYLCACIPVYVFTGARHSATT